MPITLRSNFVNNKLLRTQNTTTLDVGRESRKFAHNTYVQVFSPSVIKEQVETLKNISFFDVYALYQEGTRLGKGAFGSVVGNEQYPNLVIKSIHDLDRNASMHSDKEPFMALRNEVSYFENYYGRGTTKYFTYDYRYLMKNKDKLKQVPTYFKGKRALITMLKIPGEIVSKQLNVVNYDRWLQHVEGNRALSIRQMYLQLYGYLRDRGIYMYDLHNANVLLQLDETEDNDVELGLYPIDLSNYANTFMPYEKRLCAFSGVFEQLISIRYQMMDLVGGLLYFLKLPFAQIQSKEVLSYDIIYSTIMAASRKPIYESMKQKLSVDELCKYNVLLHRFISLSYEFCLKLRDEERDDVTFLYALQYEFKSVYFYKGMLNILEEIEKQYFNMEKLVEIRFELEQLLGGEQLEFLIFSADMLKGREHLSRDFYVDYFDFYNKERKKKIALLSQEDNIKVEQLYKQFITLMHEFCGGFLPGQHENVSLLSDIKTLMKEKHAKIVAQSMINDRPTTSSSQHEALKMRYQTASANTYTEESLKYLNKKIKTILKIFSKKKSIWHVS